MSLLGGELNVNQDLGIKVATPVGLYSPNQPRPGHLNPGTQVHY
jgi:hypothetical protein